MRTPTLPLLSALLLASLGAAFAAPTTGCSAPNVESSESMNTAEDLQQAKDVIAMLGGESGACSSCHGVNAAKVKAWGTAMSALDTACFATEGLSAEDRVNCLRSTPTSPASPFAARRLGLYAAGARLNQFKELFDSAGQGGDYAAFVAKAAMPRGDGASLSEEQFAKLKSWVLRGMPQLDAAFDPSSGDAGTDAGPASVCTPSTTPELAAHIAEMKTAGWGARLADESTTMFGCGGGTSAAGCLAAQASDEAIGTQGVAQTLKRLHSQALSSHWWVRSSADGRYVGYGMNDSAKIIDLSKAEGEAGRTIKVSADYDPYFLSSNDGFAFAGASGGAIRLCRQTLLADVGASANPSISLTESKCASVGQNVYMSIGSALEGGRYYMTFGTHENDDGGHEVRAPLPAAFGSSAATTFTPMINDGQSYRAQSTVRVAHPGEGDMMLSPSSKLAATRFGDGRKPKGFRVRLVKPTAAGAIEIPKVAEICVGGVQKPSFSFDERFLVTHQYVDRTDPAMAQLPQGSSNILFVDLSTGKQTRITTMKAGEFALYPHFRADGWLYFIVRDMNANKEYVVASDIAVRTLNP